MQGQTRLHALAYPSSRSRNTSLLRTPKVGKEDEAVCVLDVAESGCVRVEQPEGLRVRIHSTRVGRADEAVCVLDVAVPGGRVHVEQPEGLRVWFHSTRVVTSALSHR